MSAGRLPSLLRSGGPAAMVVACALALGACRGERAILQDLPPDAPAAEFTLRVPDGYEIRSIGFGAAYATDVSGGGSAGEVVIPVSGSSTQKAYVHVYAVERATGQDVLLVYADIRRRPDPVAIVRIERGGPPPRTP